MNVSASVGGNPDPAVKWVRHDAQGIENGRNLMITDIRKAESTYKYTCTAQNDVGSESVNFGIDVLCKYCKLVLLIGSPSPHVFRNTMQFCLFRIARWYDLALIIYDAYTFFKFVLQMEQKLCPSDMFLQIS